MITGIKFQNKSKPTLLPFSLEEATKPTMKVVCRSHPYIKLNEYNMYQGNDGNQFLGVYYSDGALLKVSMTGHSLNETTEGQYDLLLVDIS